MLKCYLMIIRDFKGKILTFMDSGISFICNCKYYPFRLENENKI